MSDSFLPEIELPKPGPTALQAPRPYLHTELGRSARKELTQRQQQRKMILKELLQPATDPLSDALEAEAISDLKARQAKRGRYSTAPAAISIVKKAPAKKETYKDQSIREKYDEQVEKYQNHVTACKRILDRLRLEHFEKAKQVASLQKKEQEMLVGGQVEEIESGKRRLAELLDEWDQFCEDRLELREYGHTLKMVRDRCNEAKLAGIARVDRLRQEIDSFEHDIGVLEKEAEVAKGAQTEYEKMLAQFQKEVQTRQKKFQEQLEPRHALLEFTRNQLKLQELHRNEAKARQEEQTRILNERLPAAAMHGSAVASATSRRLMDIQEGFAQIRALFGHTDPEKLLAQHADRQLAIQTMRNEVATTQNRIEAARAEKERLSAECLELQGNQADANVDVVSMHDLVSELDGKIKVADKAVAAALADLDYRRKFLVSVHMNLKTIDFRATRMLEMPVPSDTRAVPGSPSDAGSQPGSPEREAAPTVFPDPSITAFVDNMFDDMNQRAEDPSGTSQYQAFLNAEAKEISGYIEHLESCLERLLAAIEGNTLVVPTVSDDAPTQQPPRSVVVSDDSKKSAAGLRRAKNRLGAGSSPGSFMAAAAKGKKGGRAVDDGSGYLAAAKALTMLRLTGREQIGGAVADVVASRNENSDSDDPDEPPDRAAIKRKTKMLLKKEARHEKHQRRIEHQQRQRAAKQAGTAAAPAVDAGG